jgi:tRNA pseudouridine32 synthase/23S rRNA pseudouridine746 synthase
MPAAPKSADPARPSRRSKRIASLIEPLHVDDALIVVDKPAGLLSVAGRGPEGADCLHARLLDRWPMRWS